MKCTLYVSYLINKITKQWISNLSASIMLIMQSDSVRLLALNSYSSRAQRTWNFVGPFMDLSNIPHQMHLDIYWLILNWSIAFRRASRQQMN